MTVNWNLEMLLYQPPSHTYTCEIDATFPVPVPMRNVRAVSFAAVSASTFTVEVEWELLDDIDEIIRRVARLRRVSRVTATREQHNGVWWGLLRPRDYRD